MQGDHLRGIDHRSAAIGVERAGHDGPDRPEDLVSGPHGHGDPRPDEGLVVVLHRVDEDRFLGAIELGEDPAVGEERGEPFGHLAPDDRLDPGRVGLVLTPGEGEDARVAVLDRHRSVQERLDGVGDGEEVSRGEPAEGLGVDIADLGPGQQGLQERHHLGPGGPSVQGQQGHSCCPDRGVEGGGEGDRAAHDDGAGAGRASDLEQGDDGRLAGDPDAEQHGVAGIGHLIEGVVNDDRGDLALKVGANGLLGERRPQIVQDPSERRARTGGQVDQLPGGPRAAGRGRCPG